MVIYISKSLAADGCVWAGETLMKVYVTEREHLMEMLLVGERCDSGTGISSVVD